MNPVIPEDELVQGQDLSSSQTPTLSQEVSIRLDSIPTKEIYTDRTLRPTLSNVEPTFIDGGVRLNVEADTGLIEGYDREALQDELNVNLPHALLQRVETFKVEPGIRYPKINITESGTVRVLIPEVSNQKELREQIYLGVARIFRNTLSDDALESFDQIIDSIPHAVSPELLEFRETYLSIRNTLIASPFASEFLEKRHEVPANLTRQDLIGKGLDEWVNYQASKLALIDDTDNPLNSISDLKSPERELAVHALKALKASDFDYSFMRFFVPLEQTPVNY